MQRKVNEIRNNLFDTNEILWLLEGNEDMPALEFVCRYILEAEPENISDVLEKIMILRVEGYNVNDRTEEMIKAGFIHGGSGHGSAVHYILRSLSNGKI